MDAKRLCCVYLHQIAGPEGRPSPSKKPREKSSDRCASSDGKIRASGRSARGRSAGAGGRSASAVGRSAGAVGATTGARVVSKLVQTIVTGEVMEVKKKKKSEERSELRRERLLLDGGRRQRLLGWSSKLINILFLLGHFF